LSHLQPCSNEVELPDKSQQPASQSIGSSRMAVVIVSYNTRDFLRRCLRSVQENGPGEVVVVDNASTDGSAEMVREEFPAVSIRENPRNMGYGAAANQGISSCCSTYILLLNGDTVLPERFDKCPGRLYGPEPEGSSCWSPSRIPRRPAASIYLSLPDAVLHLLGIHQHRFSHSTDPCLAGTLLAILVAFAGTGLSPGCLAPCW
jgi:hypothetical protein